MQNFISSYTVFGTCHFFFFFQEILPCFPATHQRGETIIRYLLDPIETAKKILTPSYRVTCNISKLC